MKQIEAKQHRIKPTLTVNMELLKQDIILYPDSYQHERGQRLGVSRSGIYWALKRLSITYKKNTDSSQSRRRETIFIPTND